MSLKVDLTSSRKICNFNCAARVSTVLIASVRTTGAKDRHFLGGDESGNQIDEELRLELGLGVDGGGLGPWSLPFFFSAFSD
ncbi:hypothetical protein ACLOJK_011322 [Asimina triloba]